MAIDRTTTNIAYKKPSRIVYKVEPYRLKQDSSELDIEPDTTVPPESIEVDRQLAGQLAESPALNLNDGSIGEEIEEEPQQEQPVEDRLAPTIKPYTKAAVEEEIAVPQQDTNFVINKEEATPAMKSTNQRYLRILNRQYRGVSEQKEVQKHFYKWAREKARAAKEVSRKEEVRVLKVLAPKIKKPEAGNSNKSANANITDLSTALPTVK